MLRLESGNRNHCRNRVEGTYRTEVVYTSMLAAVIVIMGLIAQKVNIGGQSQQSTAPMVGLQPEASAT